MKLQFTIANSADATASERIAVDAEVITFGSDASADVTLGDLPKTAVEIRRGETMVLHRLDDEVEVTVNDKPLKDDAEIRNGSTITIGPYGILVTVQFERAPHHVRNGMAVAVTLVLIVAIIVTELLIVKWLPARIARSEIFGGEVLRQRTLYQMDYVRLVRISVPLKNSDLDPTIRQALLLYKDEADRMALHLRTNNERMSLTELKAVDADLRLLDKQLRLLAKGRLIPPQEPLNLKKLLHQELKQKDNQP